MPSPELSTFSLSDTYVFLQDGGAAPRIQVTDTFWHELMSGAPRTAEARLVADGDGWLTAVYPLTESMRSWELHPGGHELLVMLTGAMEVVLEEANGERVVELTAGRALIVPQGTWHRQVLRSAGSFLAATYGKGTRHRPR